MVVFGFSLSYIHFEQRLMLSFSRASQTYNAQRRVESRNKKHKPISYVVCVLVPNKTKLRSNRQRNNELRSKIRRTSKSKETARNKKNTHNKHHVIGNGKSGRDFELRIKCKYGTRIFFASSNLNDFYFSFN